MKKVSPIVFMNMLLIGMMSNTASALLTIKYVTVEGAGLKNGTSWDNAYADTSLQAAVNGAGVTEVWVARGTYKPTTGSGRITYFQMKNNVAIYGGFAGTESAVGQRVQYGVGEANETILSGDIGVENDSTDNSYHVFYHPSGLGLYSAAVLDGFTITGGNANGTSPHFNGGGMYNEYCSPTVRNCNFVDNAALCGGGMYLKGSIVLTDCIFELNYAVYGGGIYHTGVDLACFLQIVNSTFRQNTAGSGGGVYNTNTSMYALNSAFTHNAVTNDGGGIFNDPDCSIEVDGCSFTSNSAASGGGIFSKNNTYIRVNRCNFERNTVSHYGGGMYNDSISADITRCTFTSNSASNGGGMYNKASSSPNVDSCIFTSNAAWLGGGMCNTSTSSFSASSPRVTNCIFRSNVAAEYYGGGIFNSVSYSVVINCLFESNSAEREGGAVACQYGGGGFVNCTFKENSSAYGGAVHCYNASPGFNNCIVWGNIATGTGNEFYIVRYNYTNVTTLNYTCYSNAAGDVYLYNYGFSTSNCITADPKMLQDGRILGNSPCVNTGNNSYNAESYDIRGKIRKQGAAIDMGAFEWTSGTDPAGDVLFVDHSASGANSGASWADAFTSLQSALDIVRSGCQIWVADGTYYPSSGYDLVDASGDSTRYYHFRLINGVALYGGFNGSETALNQRNSTANVTTLSGDVGIAGNKNDNCFHVIYNPAQTPAIDTTAVLDGFTITRGNADWSNVNHINGAGMYNSYASPKVSNCIFSENTSVAHGGGMYNSDSSPEVTNCTFIQNTACYGGGMKNSASSPNVMSCMFTLNTAWEWGAGMFNESASSPHVTNCIFTRDSCYMNGGAMANDNSSPILTNCLFASNRAGSGAALFNMWSSSVITNCTFTSNYADYYGGAMCNFATTIAIHNSIMWGNHADTAGHEIFSYYDTSVVNYSCIADGANDIVDTTSMFSHDAHCIHSDPKFAGSSASHDHPYAITGLSPCLDAGNNASISQSSDIRGSGYSRKLNKTTGAAGIVDMGAYEYKVGDDPLPAVLVSFSAERGKKGVELKWQTASEVNTYGFEVQRSEVSRQPSPDSWKNIGFVNGAGNSSAPASYAFVDASASCTAAYRLKQIDRDGKFSYTHSITVTAGIPKEFSLEQNYPNPFNPVTTIVYHLPVNGHVLLTVYDAIGRETATLVNGVQEAGKRVAEFDASLFPSGIYFYTLRAGSFIETKKMLVVK